MKLLWIVMLGLFGCSGEREEGKPVVWAKVSIDELPGFHDDHLHEVLPALHASCKIFSSKAGSSFYTGHGNQKFQIHKKDWQELCSGLHKVSHKDQIKRLLKEHTTAYKITQGDLESGVFTGYYEPLLFGSLKKHGKYQTPLYGLPLKNKYLSRSAIVKGALAGKKLELVWVSSPVDAFFLQIQGSGRVVLENGKILRLGYAGSNGYPYVAIGQTMIDRKLIERKKLNMHTLKAWLKSHPEKAEAIMSTNPSYVFFRVLDIAPNLGPIGAHGVSLTPERSLAVDTSYIPLGAPMWLNIDHPVQKKRIQKMVVAQDRGGAIKGIVRGDYFWGHGAHAENFAGAMKSNGEYYVLLPKTHAQRVIP